MLVGFGQVKGLKHGHIPDWVLARKQMLESHRQAYGELSCISCGRTGLTHDREPGGRATLAHIENGKVFCEICWTKKI